MSAVSISACIKSHFLMSNDKDVISTESTVKPFKYSYSLSSVIFSSLLVSLVCSSDAEV